MDQIPATRREMVFGTVSSLLAASVPLLGQPPQF